jgi:hypothetical protein
MSSPHFAQRVSAAMASPHLISYHPIQRLCGIQNYADPELCGSRTMRNPKLCGPTFKIPNTWQRSNANIISTSNFPSPVPSYSPDDRTSQRMNTSHLTSSSHEPNTLPDNRNSPTASQLRNGLAIGSYANLSKVQITYPNRHPTPNIVWKYQTISR